MIGVILNPNASGVRQERGLAERLRAVVGEHGEVIATRGPEELDAAVERFAARGCQLVAACGGDGTNLATVTALVRRYGTDIEALPRYALLRGGTVNTVAENLGVRGRPDEILGRIVARMRAGAPIIEVGQDLLQVNDQHGFLFAAAMGARFLEAYYRGPIQGPTWATLLATRIVGSCLVQGPLARRLFSPLPCEIHADGERLPLDAARLLLASVIPDVGIGMRVTWQAGLQPNRFHLVASSLPLPSMALQMPRVLSGRPLAGDAALHVDRLVREAVLRFPEPQVYTLDGEMYRAAEVRLRVGPRIWVVKP